MSRVLCNDLDVLRNVLSVLRNVHGVLRNVLGVLHNILGVLRNVLGIAQWPRCVVKCPFPWAAEEGPIELLLAKVKNASGRIGIFSI